jgi:hypothetical protein
MTADLFAAKQAAERIVEAADMLGAAAGAPYEHRRIARMRMAAALRDEFGIIKLARAFLAASEPKATHWRPAKAGGPT